MPEFFQFPATTWYRESGPGVVPMSRNTKIGDNRITLSKPWVDFIFNVNSWKKQAMKNITASDYGPSKGYNSNGLLIYNSLVYPGRNIVKIERVLTGVDGREWGVVDGIPMEKIPNTHQYNAFDTPHLVHQLYGVSRKGNFFNLKNKTYAPLLGLNWYLPMIVLQKIFLPRAVQVKTVSLKAREKPSIDSKETNILRLNTKINVSNLETGSGGIWGETPEGWITLRFKDQNTTNWKI